MTSSSLGHPGSLLQADNPSPISVLPSECLVQIFDGVVPTKLAPDEATSMFKDEDWDKFFYDQHPNDIASVCRNWRSVALSAPSLWSRWFVNIVDGSTHAVHCLAKFVERALERSGDAMLTFYIGVHVPAKGAIIVQDIVRKLSTLEMQSRWDNIEFSIFDPYAAGGLFVLFANALPKVKELRLNFVPLKWTIELPRDSIPTHTNLRALKITITSADQLQIVDFFHSNLEELDLIVVMEGMRGSIPSTSGPPIWRFGKLRKLDINGNMRDKASSAFCRQLFDKIVACPRLEGIALSNVIVMDLEALRSMFNLLRRSDKPPITSAELNLPFIEEQNCSAIHDLLLALFDILPSITSLKFLQPNFEHVSDSMLSALTAFAGDPDPIKLRLLPNLENLVIHDGIVQQSITQLIITRWNAKSRRLRKVSLQDCKYLDDDEDLRPLPVCNSDSKASIGGFWEELEECVLDGLQFEVLRVHDMDEDDDDDGFGLEDSDSDE